MKLTARQVSELAKRPGRYGDGRGLYLQVTESLSASWLLRYQLKGRERWMGLGPLYLFGLAEARARARAQQAKLYDGIDPLDEKAEAKAAAALETARKITFQTAAMGYYEGHQNKWKSDKTREQFLSSLRNHVFPVIGNLPVSDIDTPAVLRVVEPLWVSTNETASRCRSRIEAVLDWAKVRGYRDGENPARFRGHLAEILPAPAQVQQTKHFASLSYLECPGFIKQLRGMEGIASRALEFTILTAARTGEVRFAVWSEIDFERRLWVIPADRMKMRRAHEVPLSERAIQILRAVPREAGNEHIFPGARRGSALSDTALLAVLKRMGRGELTVHGFRASFRTWASEATSHDDAAVELALAHEVGDGVRKAYQRGVLLEKRVSLMDDWSAYLSGK